MADISDVQNVLVGLIAVALYPAGTGHPSAVGFPVKVGPGWPTQGMLGPDLSSGIANISVYATDTERKTTRYQESWQVLRSIAPTLTLTGVGDTVTVGGTNPAPYSQQNVAIFVGNSPYTYAVQASDTPTSIATALAAQIAAQWPGTASAGAVITLPVQAALGALRVGGTGTAVKSIKQQDRLFQISLWCSTPAQRTALANIVDPLLSDLRFLSMPDGMAARIIYRDSPQRDLGEKARLFRRDFRFMVDFATTKTEGVAQVIVGKTTVSDNSGTSST